MAKNFITETLVLPSASTKLYGPNFDGHVTLRAMTTDEERMRLGGQSFYQTMSDIVNECIVNNKKEDGTYKLDSKNFTDFDFFAVCVKLRIMSYGPMYKTIATCLNCGHQFEYKVDLSELVYNLVPEDFVEPYEIGPLPSSGDTLGCRFLRVKDRIEIEKKRDIILAQNPDYKGDPTYNLEMERRIMQVNGEDLDYVTAEDYVHSMIAMDNYVYHDKVDENKKFGVIPYGMIQECHNPKGCNGTSMWILKVGAEFFRPCLDS
ncbi:MAG: hypothetical protein J6V44_15455 [Methanobrevibacter sp.]|nr:hypothetical protein [Methanobrevibacter sp.]MBO7692105.1 hypothetical protein [Methanobrevibacter sp.]